MSLEKRVEQLEGENATLAVDMQQLKHLSKEAFVIAVLRSKVKMMQSTDEERADWDVDQEIAMLMTKYPNADFGFTTSPLVVEEPPLVADPEA
mgnify:FL=1